jgi:membrane associated rhomboid family serine protease
VRYLPFVLVALILIALDWLALHRIQSGEHSKTAAWIVVAASGLIFGVMLGILFRPKEKKREGRGRAVKKT